MFKIHFASPCVFMFFHTFKAAPRTPSHTPAWDGGNVDILKAGVACSPIRLALLFGALRFLHKTICFLGTP